LDDDLLSDLLALARAQVHRIETSALAPQVMWRATSSRLSRLSRPNADDQNRDLQH
jgi:hypothetical protein